MVIKGNEIVITESESVFADDAMYDDVYKFTKRFTQNQRLFKGL